jgi:hypothetical protein
MCLLIELCVIYFICDLRVTIGIYNSRVEHDIYDSIKYAKFLKIYFVYVILSINLIVLSYKKKLVDEIEEDISVLVEDSYTIAYIN